MRLRIPYSTAILLGALGWVCVGYPRSLLLYDQLRSGYAFKMAWRALLGTIDFRTWDVAASLLPLGPLLFLAVLYLEATRRVGAMARRIGSALAAVVLLPTALVVTLVFSGDPAGWVRALSIVSESVYFAWALLILWCAVRPAPLGDRVTVGAAAYIGWMTALLTGVVMLEMVGRIGLRISVGTAIYLGAAALWIVFAHSLARQRASG